MRPAHGASSSHDSRRPTTASAPAPARTAPSTSRANRSSVGPPLVAALVGEARQELAHQRVLAGVDLHAVEPGRHGQPGRRAEARRPPRRCRRPPSTWGPRGCSPRAPATAPTAVAWLYADDPCPPAWPSAASTSVPSPAVARVGDGPPPRTAVGREGTPLVGPVGGVDRRLLDDDHAGPTRGAPPVVGDVPLGHRSCAGRGSSRAARTAAGWGLSAHRGGSGSSSFKSDRSRRRRACGRGARAVAARARLGVPGTDRRGTAAPPASAARRAASPCPFTHSGSGPSSGRPVKNLAAMQPPWQAS